MARRTTGPRYFPSKGGYYVTIDGQRTCLAKGAECDPSVKAEAERRYHELMLRKPTAGDATAVAVVLNAYLANLANPDTKATWGRMYVLFNKRHGRTAVRDLRQHHITEWLAEMGKERIHPVHGHPVKWNQSMRRIAITSLKAAFAWACNEGLITVNPAAKLKKPTVSARGADILISEQAYQDMLRTARPATRDLLVALNDSGARPGEVYRVEARHYRPEIQAWVLPTSKTGKVRIIYLTARLVELTERLAASRPVGPLFRNRKGNPWDNQVVSSQFKRFRKKLGLKRVSAYSFRHKFATEFLLAGGSMAYLAQLQGNSVAILEKHYAHLREHGTEVRQKLLDFRPPPGQQAPGLAPPRVAVPSP